MNRKRLIMIGVLAMAVAAVISIALYRVLRLSLNSANAPTAVVVVANADLPVGAKVEERDLRLVKMPAGDLPSGAFRSTSEVAGRGVLVPISKNEMVLASKLAAENGGSGLPSLIPAGMRAVSVKVNDVVAVAGFAVPGTRVDVILTGNPTKQNDPAQITTTTVLQNIEVLAAGQSMQRSSEGEAKTVTVITLLVSPEDAQKLALASGEGRIQLSLRNPLDLEAQNTPILKNAALYKGGSSEPEAPRRAAKPALRAAMPPPAEVYVVEMIRGGKRDVTKF